MTRYTHRVAISNDRLLAIDDDQHVLPRGFVRIRYYGLLANRTRKANLERARELLQAQPPPQPASVDRESWDEFLLRLTGVDPGRCPPEGGARHS